MVGDFAYRTFKWHNEAKGNAAVHCVIIGFHARNGDIGDHEDNGDVIEAGVPSPKSPKSPVSPISNRPKNIYDPDGTAKPASHINGYLMPAPDVLLESRSRPRCPRTW